MTPDEVTGLFEKLISGTPATMQITGGDPKILGELFDHFADRAQGLGWLVGRVALSLEADKYPGMPIRYHLEDALRDWLRPPVTNDKLLLGILKAQGSNRSPALVLIDGSDFPDDQRLLSVKQQMRVISNRQSELNLWIVFAVDPRTAALSPSVASEAYLDVKLAN